MSDAVPADQVSGDDRALVAGTLRGYRTWRIVPRGVPLDPGVLPLASVTRPHVTWPPMLSASCTSVVVPSNISPSRPEPTHCAPARDCNCGIYAWYSPQEARNVAAEVFGVVQASGLVLLGTSGFRAEQARIAAIVTRNRRVAEACNDAGIVTYRRRRDLLADHPPDDVASMIGEAPAERVWHPRSFALLVCFSVWTRVAILIAAAGLLSPAAIIASVVITECMVLAIVGRHLFRARR